MQMLKAVPNHRHHTSCINNLNIFLRCSIDIHIPLRKCSIWGYSSATESLLHHIIDFGTYLRSAMRPMVRHNPQDSSTTPHGIVNRAHTKLGTHLHASILNTTCIVASGRTCKAALPHQHILQYNLNVKISEHSHQQRNQHSRSRDTYFVPTLCVITATHNIPIVSQNSNNKSTWGYRFNAIPPCGFSYYIL